MPSEFLMPRKNNWEPLQRFATTYTAFTATAHIRSTRSVSSVSR